MSRRNNNVRGPSSALTEFLRESGITPTTIARRVQLRQANEAQPAAGPSTQPQEDQEDVEMEDAQQTRPAGDGYQSDNLDEPEDPPPTATRKRKLTKAAEAKLKAKETEKAKKKAKKDDDGDYEDEDEDPYSALSKMWKDDLPKPPVGSFETCVRCQKQFTVTKYTMAANPPPGYLCHPCAKSSGSDPFKEPAAPRKRKPAAERRNVASYEERRLPSLASICIEVISKHIDDVEALGDIGTMNMDEIAKALAKNRSLTADNAMLFYNAENERLTLYDVTNLTPPALCTLASLNPNLRDLRLDFCGRMDDTVMSAWGASLPQLKRVELLGPFLVRAPAWQTFFQAHPGLEGFLITQSPRFDVECMRMLVQNCPNLHELRLKEVGKLSDEFLEQIKPLGGQLTYLDLSYPGTADALSESALIDLLAHVGSSLEHLDLSGNTNVTDAVLFRGIKPHARALKSLALANTPELTDAGVAEFFETYDGAARLATLDLSRNHELADAALGALLAHSGAELTELNINGWKAVSEDALKGIPRHAPALRRLDVGFCREVHNFFVKEVLERCPDVREVKVWGCQRINEHCPRKRGVSVLGIEMAPIY
ncbi:RNI-like protein [Pilatotrama ljubarskyi]|nr:RNI-like protein [Pilatotrama ljubarskyi]